MPNQVVSTICINTLFLSKQNDTAPSGCNVKGRVCDAYSDLLLEKLNSETDAYKMTLEEKAWHLQVFSTI